MGSTFKNIWSMAGHILPRRTGRMLAVAVALALLLCPLFLGANAQADTVTFTGAELLGTPTDTSITINIVPASAIEYLYEYGTAEGGPYPNKTPKIEAAAGQPHEVVITGLAPDTRYYYRMIYDGDMDADWDSTGDGDYELGAAEHTFRTQRAAGRHSCSR